MLFIPHIAAGLFIADIVNNPVAIAGLAFLSHFILDLMPHWDPRFQSPKKGVDLRFFFHQKPLVFRQTLAVIFIQLFIILSIGTVLKDTTRSTLYFIGGVSAVLPDMYEWLAGLINLPTIHFFTHKHTDWISGLLVQIALSLGFLYFLKP